MKTVSDAIGEAWNVQNDRKVYQLHFGTSDVDGILLALKEAGYVICRMDGGVHTGTCPTCGCKPVTNLADPADA